MNPDGQLPKRFVTLYDTSLMPYLADRFEKHAFGLIPPRGVGRVMGWHWWRALTRKTGIVTIFDADDGAGLAAHALRNGERWVICACSPSMRHTLHDLARHCGGQILDERPEALDLGAPPYKAFQIHQLEHYLSSRILNAPI